MQENEDSLSNIIAFTGNRGQGKTSAMLTFVNELMCNKGNSSICFGEKTKTIQFLELDVIDPSTFEDMHNIVEVIVTKMYNAYREERRKRKKDDGAELETAFHIKMLESFQSVYEGLSLVRNPRKFDDLEQDFEGTISKIARAGDSAKLKQNMHALVAQYLEFFSKNDKISILVVPIDDLDVNISLAYKMMEQIRKYLILPNLILIMAVKIEQLRYCVELQFRKEMALLIEKKQRIFDEEPIDMANKYVAKLIPDARKIALPELHLLISKDEDNESFEVEYMINGKNIFSEPEKATKGAKYTFENKLLALIYKTTGIVFVCSQKQVHPIVPHTLRELVNLASVLGKMGNDISLENLEIFEDYFVNTWIPSQLDDGYVRDIRSLFLVQTPALHLLLCSILLDKLENIIAYTLDTFGEDNKEKVFSKLKEFIFKKSQTEISLGDVVSLLNFIENRYTDQAVKLFVFSVRTVYSIIMRKMVLNKQTGQLSAFVGSSVFGKSIIPSKAAQYVFDRSSRINNIVQSNAAGDASRVEFPYDAKTFLGLSGDYLTKSVEKEQSKNISMLLFFSNFSEDFKYFISGNNAYNKNPIFSLENLFISPLYDYNKKFSANSAYSVSKDGVPFDLNLKRETISAATTNLEFMDFLYDYCRRRKDPGRTTTDVEHIRNFLNNLNHAANEYLFQDMFNKEHIDCVVTSFECFWEFRTDLKTISSADEIISLRQKIEKNKLSKILRNDTFQTRAKNILELCENNAFMKNDVAQKVLTNIKKQLSVSMEQKATEKIKTDVKINFNSYISDLLKTLEKIGDEA